MIFTLWSLLTPLILILFYGWKLCPTAISHVIQVRKNPCRCKAFPRHLQHLPHKEHLPLPKGQHNNYINIFTYKYNNYIIYARTYTPNAYTRNAFISNAVRDPKGPKGVIDSRRWGGIYKLLQSFDMCSCVICNSINECNEAQCRWGASPFPLANSWCREASTLRCRCVIKNWVAVIGAWQCAIP